MELPELELPGELGLVLEPELLPLELPEPMPLPGEAGDVVLLPLAPVPALEPDLLKCASHSARET